MQGFIVEDGSGLVDSTSYMSVADADSYHALYGNLEWTSVTDADLKESALVRATKAIDLLYGEQFQSFPLTHSAYIQSLLWPRLTVIINGIQIVTTGQMPKQLKDATAEVALMALNGVDVVAKPSRQAGITSAQTQLDTLSSSVTYQKPVKTEQFTGFWKIEQILKPLLVADGSTPSFFHL